MEIKKNVRLQQVQVSFLQSCGRKQQETYEKC